MPTEIATATANIQSQTSTVGAIVLFRQRHATALAQIETATTAFDLGRDRHVGGMVAKTEVFASADCHRDRVVLAVANIVSETSGNKLASMPSPIAPIGNLWLNGRLLSEQSRLQKGQSLQLRFDLLGKKLANLRAKFTLYDLAGKLLIEKLESILPGGLAIEYNIPKADGLVNYAGYVFIDRTETLFLEYDRELEVEYILEIGNSRINYPIERGFLTFVGR
jgi:hypothetical protein